MAIENNIGTDFTLPAGADLSASQYLAVKVNSSAQAVLAGAGDQAVGVLQNKPKLGEGAAIRAVGPISKMVAGGTFNAGDLLTSDASGKAVKYTAASVSPGTPEPLAGSHVLGVALEAGVASRIVAVALTQSGLSN